MSSRTGLGVVLPAGGRISGEFARVAGADLKALIAFNGKTVLEHTLDVLQQVPAIARCIVVGPTEVCEVARRCGADAAHAEESDGPENLYLGLERLQDSSAEPERALVLTTDLPFLTAENVEHLLASAPRDADISVPIVRREAFEARFPGRAHECVSLADGQWTMGCGFVVQPSALIRARPHVARVFAARKSPLRMALLLGVPFVLSWLAHRLTVEAIVRRCGALLGCHGSAILEADPELAFDVDKIEEYTEALGYLQDLSPEEVVA